MTRGPLPHFPHDANRESHINRSPLKDSNGEVFEYKSYNDSSLLFGPIPSEGERFVWYH